MKKTPNQQKIKNRGYSLVEVLVAITILIIAVIAPMTVASRGIQVGVFAREQATAIFLAQEAIEMVTAVRNEYALLALKDSNSDLLWDWVGNEASKPLRWCFVVGHGCNVYWGQGGGAGDIVTENCDNSPDSCRMFYNDSALRGRYVITSPGDPTPFRRLMRLEEVDDGVVNVRVRVEWGSNLFGGGTQSVELSSVVRNVYADLLPEP